ncbi:1-aminocyclopropane-1-carboxylate deaminase/D-cysteine desulfhydrase [Ancylobacter terrae]|uniref:1-aminocyclopropane-1-carboxylate deaminase/D-cysteine desulfhydrase n=1 Tax=Ancylobacter sp. sgz301288 TaxID=3342077 RepID=UPI00385E8E3D
MCPAVSETARQRLATIARTPLVALPTPLDRAERLGSRLGLALWIKRDDLTGLGLGGNKLRKLEFILADALANGVDTLLTTGGAQSNHARLTAAVAARAGLACELYLKGEPTTARAGNLLLDELFGAAIHFCGMIDYRAIDARMAARVEELAAAGRKGLAVPLGGATGLGTLGYVLAFREILDQMAAASDERRLTLAVTGGTGSTAAGLLLGASIWAPQTRFLVVSASWKEEILTAEIRRCALDAADLLGVPAPHFEDVVVSDAFVGPGYAQPSEEGTAAILETARTEGIVLDGTYTGKAMSGLMALSRAGTLASKGPVVFLHSGGIPEIFVPRGP